MHDDKPAVSVVLSTYNRAEILPASLESLLSQETGGLPYEVVVVDNNSTDHTRQVIETFRARAGSTIRHLFEARQGLSYARNAGIAASKAPIIAFTDDDVSVSPDWILQIRRALDKYPDASFVGGKVLPRWEMEAPAWLTHDHWSPLALQDNGSVPFAVNSARPVCLVGANLAIRREVFAQVGLFAPELQRVRDGIGSLDEYELLLRIWQAGGQGMYVPTITVVTDVPTTRLTKAYHRRWHRGQGKFFALMRLYERCGPEGHLIDEPTDLLTLFGTPAFVYRQLFLECARWLAASLRLEAGLSFRHENQVRLFLSYMRQRYRDTAQARKRPHLREVSRFATTLVHKRLRRAR